MFIFFCGKLFPEPIHLNYVDSCGNIIRTVDVDFSLRSEKPNPILNLFQQKKARTRKFTAALLAFPFPFGIVGLHRIYLGTKPYVPVAYIASLGGVFGILPLIDFFAIIFDKNFDRFENNGKVFMWISGISSSWGFGVWCSEFIAIERSEFKVERYSRKKSRGGSQKRTSSFADKGLNYVEQ
jgi:TM2 domain-containing membrane protein YozV